MSSETRSDILVDRLGTGPTDLLFQSASKAVAHFDGSASPVLEVNLNVSSMIQNSAGFYLQTHINPFASDAYTMMGDTFFSFGSSAGGWAPQPSQLAGSFEFRTGNGGASATLTDVSTDCKGDLA